MRRMIVFLACLSALALWVAPAMAGIGSTAHDSQINLVSTSQGRCGACHLPHGAVGDRLWPAPIGTVSNVRGDVALLCAYCHFSTGGGKRNDAEANANAYVYATYSHGVYMSVTTGVLPNQQQAPTTPPLPYVSNASDQVIECTSCHNVHEDGIRPFLRADINAICAVCHGQRMIESTPAWVTADAAMSATGNNWTDARQELGNPGSHPVGRDVDVAGAGNDNPVVIPGLMRNEFGGTVAWTLGGHLTDGLTGGVTCTTCHAPHGVKLDAQAASPVYGANVGPTINMLVVGQAGVTRNSRTVANGDGDVRNYLCEACHQGQPINYATYSFILQTTGWSNPTKASNPNPGATSWTHPADAMISVSGTLWVTAFPTAWPVGGNSGANVSNPNVLCESCHVAHGWANRDRDDLNNLGGANAIANTGAGTDYMLRGSFVSVCGECHSGSTSRQDHHPVGDTFSNIYSANGQNFSVTYLVSVPDAAASLVVTCGTCHGGTGSGAHNWTGSALSAYALDPKWVPYNNARQLDTTTKAVIANSISVTCMDCHFGLAPVTGFLRPTDGKGIQHITEPGYAVLGAASHFQGVSTMGGFAWTSTAQGALGAKINPETQDWDTNAMGGVNNAWSRFGTNGGTGVVVVCESCHELEMNKNVGADHLLLSDFNEADMGASQSRLCNGCHLPPGTHPLTSSIIGRREGGLLQTDTSSAWLKTPGSTPIQDANLTFPLSTDYFNCDSCHQVHDAVSNSLTFLLDASSTTVASSPITSETPASGTYAAKYFAKRATPKSKVSTAGDIDTERFCSVCHPYN